jgi:nicotinamide mononucleotide transporter
MSDLLISFIAYAESLPWLELVAMLLALAYVLLAAAGSIWCWPAALISTAIYTYVFYDVLLLMDSALSIYYLVMAVYGYWAWQQRTPTKNEQNSPPLDIVSWQFSVHVKACLVLTFIALALGYVMENYTPADFPYLDTFTTVFAVFATYLVAQKVLENWLYWIVIDAASIYLYIEKDLMPTVVLFSFYTVIATWGYLKWRSLYSDKQVTIEHRVNG